MKKVFASLFAVLLYSLVLAQTAPKFSYQAVVRNAANELVADDTVAVRVRFYNHDASGTAVYSERHSVVSNSNGLISLLIGEGTAVTGSLSQVTWDDALVSTEITLRGGYFVTDVKPVTAVPIAYYAEQIPLQALEEHLGSTDLVSATAMRDTLAHYVTTTELAEAFDSYTGQMDGFSGVLSDSLANYVPRAVLEAALQSLRNEINAMTSSISIVDNITVTSYQTTSNRFVLEHFPMSGRKVLMFINGVLISQNAYAVTENQVQYLPVSNGNKVLEEGDRIQIYYYYK